MIALRSALVPPNCNDSRRPHDSSEVGDFDRVDGGFSRRFFGAALGDGHGGKAVSGLGRAFLYAGARAWLVSNWPVETTSVKMLTTDLFRRHAEDPTLSRAEALRRAMVGLIDGDGRVDPKTGEAVFSYAHPLFWAPFSLIGDGGGGRPTS